MSLEIVQPGDGTKPGYRRELRDRFRILAKRFRQAAMPTTDDKAARLAAQLRANLKRRKEQARGSAAPVTKPDDARPRED